MAAARGTLSKKGGLLGNINTPVPMADPSWVTDDPQPAPMLKPLLQNPMTSTSGLTPMQLQPTNLPRVSTALMDREDAVQNDLAKRMAPKSPATGVLGKIGRVASTVGNILGDVFAPAATSLIPGSDLYNERIMGRDKADLDQISNLKTEEAQRGQTAANTEYLRQRPDIARAQMLAGISKTAVPKGFKPATFDENGNIVLEEDPNSSAYHDRENLRNYRDVIANKAQVMADIAANKYKPGTEEYAELQTRLQHLKNEEAIALGNLGMRRAEYQAHAFGKDAQGNPLPGSLMLPDGASVGTLNAENVRPTSEQRNTAGRAQIVKQMGQHLAEEMSDPEIAPYLGPGAGRIAELEAHGGVLPEKVSRFKNDLISYGAFQAGFHPVKGIGALEYFDKVMGGLGQSPESLRGKLLSNEDTSNLVQDIGTPKVATGKRSSPSVKKFNPKTGRLE